METPRDSRSVSRVWFFCQSRSTDGGRDYTEANVAHVHGIGLTAKELHPERLLRRVVGDLRPDLGPLAFQHVENLLGLLERGDVGVRVCTSCRGWS